jgi:uncharacterized protein DUF3108
MGRLINFSFILLIIFPQWLLAQEIPDFSAKYTVSLKGIHAGDQNSSLMTNDDGLRVFKSTSQATGIFSFFKPELVEETSVWQLHSNFVRPNYYLYQRTGGKKDKYMQLTFDWQANQLHIDDKKHPWSLPLEPYTLDKLVYQLALMSDLANNKTLFNYRIADGGKLKTYTIKIVDSEMVTTPLGKIEAVKLIRQRNPTKKRQTTLWCAPTLNYLPVKLEHIEKDGSKFTAVINQLQGFNLEQAFQPIKTTETSHISQ